MNPEKAIAVVKQSRRIEGWLEDEAVMLFAWIDEIQKNHGIRGDLFEIGTHHGKSAMCLAAMAEAEHEELKLCDIFGHQGDNISESGRGDLGILKTNLSPFQESGLRISFFEQNSTSLSADDLGGQYRFFHIDGGHNVEEALSDLRLAAGTLLPQGVIALDDPFQPGWPGVTEALIRFLDENRNFCAFVVGYNKLLLAHREYVSIYQDELRMEANRRYYRIGVPWEVKELPFNGDQLIIFFLSAYLQKHRYIFRMRKFYRAHDWMNNPVFAPLVAVLRKIVQLGETD